MSFRFSLGRFSTPATPEGEAYDIDLRIHLSEAINTAISLEALAEINDLMFFESIDGNANSESGIPFTFSTAETLIAEAYEAHSILTTLNLKEDIEASADMGAFLGVSAVMNETLYSSADLGAVVGFGLDMNELLLATADIGALIHSNCTFSEIVGGSADVFYLEEKSTLITVSLPPGSELHFDTENYNILLDGVNILHLQEGDWFRLNRDLMDITVDSGVKGSLDGRVIYQERWL